MPGLPAIDNAYVLFTLVLAAFEPCGRLMLFALVESCFVFVDKVVMLRAGVRDLEAASLNEMTKKARWMPMSI